MSREFAGFTGRVWVAGRAWSDGRKVSSWEVLGIYSRESLAVERCTTPSDFVGELELDQDLPDDSCEWPDCYYPLDPEPIAAPEDEEAPGG